MAEATRQLDGKVIYYNFVLENSWNAHLILFLSVIDKHYTQYTFKTYRRLDSQLKNPISTQINKVNGLNSNVAR